MKERFSGRIGQGITYALACLAALCVVLALGGCVSTQARLTEQEFAIRSEHTNTENAAKKQQQTDDLAQQLLQFELDRLQANLVAQNEAAQGDPEEISKNYIAYFAAVEKAKGIIANEVSVSASLYAEDVQNGTGYGKLIQMSQENQQIAQQAAKDAIAQAITAGQKMYAAYQEAHPVPVATPAPTPTPTVEVTE